MRIIRPAHVLIIAFLAVVVLGGGTYVIVREFGPRTGAGRLPSAADALERVPVWLGEGDDLRVMLRPCYQWPEADRANDRLLSAYLFPRGEGARFVVLWVFNYASEGGLVYDRLASPVTLVASDGHPVSPLDLPAAFARAELRADIRLGLQMLHADRARIEIPAGAYRRVLVALPAACDVFELDAVRIFDLGLTRREIVRSRLEDYLADPGDRDPLLPGGS